MKKASKFLFIILISLLCFQSYAQTFGIKGGLNLSNMLIESDGETEDLKMNPGFHIGGIIDFQFTDLLSLETGIILDTKGFKFEDEGSGYSYKEKLNLFYLDIPVVLKVSIDVGSSVKIFGVAGPYIGVGLTGKWKSVEEYQGDEDTDEEKVDWGNTDDDHLKRFDYGLEFGAGVEIKAFLIGVSYDLGLANISAYTDYETKIKNRVLRITVGFWFGKN